MVHLAQAPWWPAPASTVGTGVGFGTFHAAAPGPTAGPPLNILQQRDANSLAGYSYLGCYQDTTTRLLTGAYNQLVRNNPRFCGEMCFNLNSTYEWFGLENSDNCFCGDAPAWKSLVSLPAASCDSTCPGAGSATCGGIWAMNLYSATSVPPDSQPPASGSVATTAALSGYTQLGCFTDANSRILGATGTFNVLRNNPQYCCEWCTNMNPNYEWCGVEAGNQCFCDSTSQSGLSAAATDCSQNCPGASNAICGGVWRINMYRATGVKAPAPSSLPSTDAGVTTPAPGGNPTQTSPPPPPSSGSSSLSGGAIAGIVIGVLAAVAVAAGALWFFRRRRAGAFGGRSVGAGGGGGGLAQPVPQGPAVELGPGKTPYELEPGYQHQQQQAEAAPKYYTPSHSPTGVPLMDGQRPAAELEAYPQQGYPQQPYPQQPYPQQPYHDRPE